MQPAIKRKITHLNAVKETELPKKTEQPKGKTSDFWAGIIAAKVILGVVFCLATGQGLKETGSAAWGKVMDFKHAVLERLTIVKVVEGESKPEEEKDLKSILKAAAEKHQVDPLVLSVLLDKESAGGKWLYRFEPKVFEKVKKDPRYQKFSEDEKRMLASSHGHFHVLGTTSLSECGISWNDHYNAEASADCAALIVANLYKKTADIKDAGERIREVFRRYNGSGEMAEKYAADALSRLVKNLYKGVVSSENG